MTNNEKIMKLIEQRFFISSYKAVNENFETVLEDVRSEGLDENIVSIYRSKNTSTGQYVYGTNLNLYYGEQVILSGQACSKKDLNVFIGYDAISFPIFTGDLVAVYDYSVHQYYKSILKNLPEKITKKIKQFNKNNEEEFNDFFLFDKFFTGIAIKNINKPYYWLSCEHFGFEGEALLNKSSCVVLNPNE